MTNSLSFKDTDFDDKTDLTNDSDVPDIDEMQFTSKETYYCNAVKKFFKTLDSDKIDLMLDVIEGQSNISLRLLDWFVTRFANKYKISYCLETLNNVTQNENYRFNVHISYKAQLKSYKKRYFDPFRRRKKFFFSFKNNSKPNSQDVCLEKKLCTTIGQLNFFKWAFSNKLLEYVQKNFDIISKAMIVSNKEDKNRKNKDSKSSDKNSKKKDSVGKTPEKRKDYDFNINKQIILSFD